MNDADPNLERLPHLMPRVRAALEEAREEIRRHYGDRLDRLVLYGSQARGEAREDSDVDVLVVLAGEVDALRELRALASLKLDLLLRHEASVSMQPLSADAYADAVRRPERSTFLRRVRADGVEL